MVALGGVCGCSGGHAWLLQGVGGGGRGACVVCHSVHRGGMHGCSGRVCVVALGGHVWLLWGGMCGCSGGVCVVALGGMRGCSRGVCGCSGEGVVAPGGHVWLLLGGHAWLLREACVVDPRGACMVAPGGHVWLLLGGHVWDMMRYRDTINEQVVRILLECILVSEVCVHILSTGRTCMVASGGACVVAWGGAWLLWGACVVAPGGHVWLLWRGVHGCSGGVRVYSRGACVVAPGGMCGCSGGGMHGCSGGACVGYDEIRRYCQ